MLEHLLLAARSPDDIERSLGERKRLTSHRLDHTHPKLERIAALTKLSQPLLDAPGVLAGFPKMLLQPVAIAALWRHRDLRLKLAH